MNDAALDKEALGVVALGMDVERFLGGPIGRYLVKRAEEARSDALEALAHCDPECAVIVRAFQNKVAVVDMVQQWLADAITEAQNAEQQLHEQSD